MKFIVSSSGLLRQLQALSGVLNTSNPLPILDNFLFVIEKGTLTVSASDLETAMNAYNRVLLETCQEEGLECFDLAGTVPKNGTVFYDDDHYTDAGARIVADRLLDYLLANPPFSKGPSTAVLGKSN